MLFSASVGVVLSFYMDIPTFIFICRPQSAY